MPSDTSLNFYQAAALAGAVVIVDVESREADGKASWSPIRCGVYAVQVLGDEVAVKWPGGFGPGIKRPLKEVRQAISPGLAPKERTPVAAPDVGDAGVR